VQEHPGNGSSPWRNSPHVAVGAVAASADGLDLLLRDGRALACHTSAAASVYHSESGVVAAVLSVGYNIDCLLARCVGTGGGLRHLLSFERST